jgi:hypothetical protein
MDSNTVKESSLIKKVRVESVFGKTARESNGYQLLSLR